MCLIAAVVSKKNATLWSDGFVLDRNEHAISTDTSKLFRMPGGQVIAVIGDVAAIRFAQELQHRSMRTEEVAEAICRFTRFAPDCNAGFTLVGERGANLWAFTACADKDGFAYTQSGLDSPEAQADENAVAVFFDGLFEERDEASARLAEIAKLGYDGACTVMRRLFAETIEAHPSKMGGSVFIETVAVSSPMPADAVSFGRTKIDGINTGYVWATKGINGVKSIKGVGDSQTLDLDSEIVDGLTYARIKSDGLDTGDLRTAYLSDQSSGWMNNLSMSGQVDGGTGWTLIATLSVFLNPNVKSIKLHCTYTNVVTGGTSAATGVGFAIYSGAAPASPQVSSVSTPVDLTLNNPATGYVTIGLYIQTTTATNNSGRGTGSADAITQFANGVLT